MTNTALLPDLRDMLEANDVDGIHEFCAETHPEVVVEFLSALTSGEIWRVLRLLASPLRADIFAHFDLDQQVELVSGSNRTEMARLIEEMPSDDRADLVQELDETVRDEILPLVARAEREDIRKLVSYQEGTAGAVMTSEYAALRAETTVTKALEQIRAQAAGKEMIYYLYVIDNTRKLMGFVSLRDLILAKPNQTVADIMFTDVISAQVDSDQEEAARQIEKYDLLALPIVTADNELVGIVTHDDAVDIIRQEQSEDLEKLMAISGEHEVRGYLKASAWVHFKRRSPWIVGLAALSILSGLIIHSYEAMLTDFIILAMYLPMLADAGGNTGSQSATVVVRALALNEVRPSNILRILRKELTIAILLGLLVGLFALLRVLLMSRGIETPEGFPLQLIAVAIGVAMMSQVVTATLVGALLPLAAARVNLDPAIVASPALTTMVDVTGLLLYFGIVKLILGL